jgi:hypothetical protein
MMSRSLDLGVLRFMSTKLLFGLSGFFLLFALMFYFRNDRRLGGAQESTLDPARPIQQATPEPMKPTVPLPTSVTGANPEDFRIIRSDQSAGDYEFQLDARILRQELPVTVSYGDRIESWLDGKVCANPQVPCVGPYGQGMRPADTPTTSEDWVKYKLGTFPVKDALFQAAVAYFGNMAFPIGNYKSEWPIPAGTANQHLVVGYNIHEGEESIATGGGKLKLKITRRLE